MESIFILGAGVTGLTSSYLLKDKYKLTILEKKDCLGGLCKSFEIDGFYFDYGAHAAFTKNIRVKKLLEKNVQYDVSISKAMNYKKEKWIKQPVQNNLYPLEIDEKIKIIKDFLLRQDDGNYCSYADWLEKKYGKYFADNYPRLYTKKYWTVKPEVLETKWIGPRMYTPSIEEVLLGSYVEETPDVHYAGEIRYPNKGGFGQFLNRISNIEGVIYNVEIDEINPLEKYLCYNGEKMKYDRLISTIPLPEIIEKINNVPQAVRSAANNLNYTSLVVVSLGISRKSIIPNGAKCFYVYDEDMLISRAYSTSAYGSNNAPDGCSTLQAEVYFSKFKPLNMSLEDIKDRVIQEFTELNLIQKEDIVVSDVRMEKYANIVFTPNIYENRKIVHDYLDSCDIYYAGRFGEWDYLWSDQSVLSGMKIADTLS